VLAADIGIGEVIPEIRIIDVGLPADATLETDRQIFPGIMLAIT